LEGACDGHAAQGVARIDLDGVDAPVRRHGNVAATRDTFVIAACIM
jgi:hypothetical protein